MRKAFHLSRALLKSINDLYCEWWVVKLYSLTHSLLFSQKGILEQLLINVHIFE